MPACAAASHFNYFRDKRRAFRLSNLSHSLTIALDEFERCLIQLGSWHHQCTYRSGRRGAEIATSAVLRIRPELWRFLGHSKACYELLQAGLYSEHLQTWRSQFPADAIRVIDAGLLLSAPLRVMRRFEKHLGLPSFNGYDVSQDHALAPLRATAEDGLPRPGEAASAALAAGVDATLLARLQAFFMPFNRKLKRATGVGWNYEGQPGAGAKIRGTGTPGGGKA